MSIPTPSEPTSASAKGPGSMPTSPIVPTTPGLPPAALHQPKSRPLSYAYDRNGPDAGFSNPTSPTYPSALPALPPTPGLPRKMSLGIDDTIAGGISNGTAHSMTSGPDMYDTQPAQPVQHDFSHRPGDMEMGRGGGGGGGGAGTGTGRLGSAGAATAAATAWSPAHPCFPHPNPHVPLSSPLYDATRVIRIPRDWMAAGDLYPAFSTTYPEILLPWVGEDSFRSLVNQINDALRRAFEPATGRAVLEGLLGLVSGWVLEDAGLIGPKKRVRDVEAVVDRWNADRTRSRARGGAGDKYRHYQADPEDDGLVMVVPLRRTAYMSLDIQIPDPKIRIVGDEGEDNGDDGSALHGGDGQSRDERMEGSDVGGIYGTEKVASTNAASSVR